MNNVNETLFNSLERPVPPVRHDLQLIPLNSNGDSVLYFHDMFGYVPANFALHQQAEPILSLINGRFSIRHISHAMQGKVGEQDLLEFIRFLDENCILDSVRFRYTAKEAEKAFEKSKIRPAALAGETYPGEPLELNKYLREILAFSENAKTGKTAVKALYAPHIDPRVGEKIYSSAFSTLANLKPKRVVIFGTAHYTGYYEKQYENTPFIGTEKSFELPHVTIDTDIGYIHKLKEVKESTGFTTNDRAHRIEHSIELHLLFASHLWKHPFTIVPILVNSFNDLFYLPDGDLSKKIKLFTARLRELDDADTFYLISGDLAHVGRKFGDQAAAAVMRNDVEEFDKKFLKLAVDNSQDELFRHIQTEYDPYRICGFPPLYTFLNLFPQAKGTQLDYHWWDETERESAVSFASIIY